MITVESEERIVRILYCSVGLAFGGEQKQLVKMLSHLDRGHFEPFVCCIRQFGYIEDEIRSLASKFIGLQVRNRYDQVGEVRGLRRVIKENKIDLIQTSIFSSEFSALVAAMSTGLPVIAFLPTMYDLAPRFAAENSSRANPYLQWRARYMVHALLARTVNVHYVAYSQAIKESAIRNLYLPPERITVFPMGQNLDKFEGTPLHRMEAASRVKAELGLDKAYPILLNVARLLALKGQKDLLQLMPRILERFPRAKLLIAGDGPIQMELERLRDQLGLQGAVHLLGRRDDIADLLQASDQFVFSSHYEGLPGAVVEAMAAGKPVVAFDIPALKEVIEDGCSGVVVEGRNRDRMAEAVIQIAEHPEMARQMGDRAKHIVREKFDIRQNMKSLEALYYKVLEGSSAVS